MKKNKPIIDDKIATDPPGADLSPIADTPSESPIVDTPPMVPNDASEAGQVDADLRVLLASVADEDPEVATAAAQFPVAPPIVQESPESIDRTRTTKIREAMTTAAKSAEMNGELDVAKRLTNAEVSPVSGEDTDLAVFWLEMIGRQDLIEVLDG